MTCRKLKSRVFIDCAQCRTHSRSQSIRKLYSPNSFLSKDTWEKPSPQGHKYRLSFLDLIITDGAPRREQQETKWKQKLPIDHICKPARRWTGLKSYKDCLKVNGWSITFWDCFSSVSVWELKSAASQGPRSITCLCFRNPETLNEKLLKKAEGWNHWKVVPQTSVLSP